MPERTEFAVLREKAGFSIEAQPVLLGSLPGRFTGMSLRASLVR